MASKNGCGTHLSQEECIQIGPDQVRASILAAPSSDDPPLSGVGCGITSIPMGRGFMYLRGIIDLYSRYIVGWQLSNSLEKENQTSWLKRAIDEHGKPEIINTDQGAPYTCAHWVETLRELQIRISMDGKGRATDHAIIGRWFRTLKRKYMYLNPPQTGWSLLHGIRTFVDNYNPRRHPGINRKKPVDMYVRAA